MQHDRSFFARLTTGLIAGLCLLCAEVAAADCNGNGRSDARDASEQDDCNQNGIPDECEVAPLPFATTWLGVEGTALVVSTSDFDGDGLPDIVSGNRRSGGAIHLAVFLNRRSGDFEKTVYEIEGKLRDLGVGDLDGDGDPDLAAVDTDAARVLFNRGDGSFSPPTRIAAVRGLASVVTGDFDGDGIDDLAVTNKTTHAVSVFLAREGGVFDPPASYAVGDGPVAIDAADFDGDGRLDLVTGNLTSISILLARESGGFAAETRLETGQDGPRHLLARDVDGDGRSDLVATVGGSLLRFVNKGDGTFQEPSRFVLDAAVLRAGDFLASGDINGDGDLDFLTGYAVRSREITAVVGRGGVTATALAVNFEAEPYDAAVGDFDADGDLDLVTASVDNVGVLWNNQAKGLSLRSEFYSIVGRPHFMTLADLDGDGDLDVATSNSVDSSSVLAMNRGDGTLQVRNPLQLGGVLSSIAAADLDGDGDVDLALSDSSGIHRVRVLMNPGNAGFREAASYPVEQWPLYVGAEDLDGDGAVDLMTANDGASTISLLFNQGDGVFQDQRAIRVGSGPRAIATGDFDGDGNLDLAVSNFRSSSISVLLARAPGEYAGPIEYDAPGPWFVVAADLDGDGDLDLATANQEARSSTLLWNRGDGTFPSSGTLVLFQAPYSLLPVDMNDDGAIDLVMVNANAGSVSVHLNTGSGDFGSALSFPVGSVPRFGGAGDMDGDGDVDLVAANRSSSEITVLLNEDSREPFQEPFRETICTEKEFHDVSIEVPGEPVVDRLTKYIVPARPADQSLLPPYFQNVNVYKLHQEFLAGAFPERFPALGRDAYDRMVNHRATREYFVGNVYRLRVQDGILYGFSVLVDDSDPRELPTVDEVRSIYETLRGVFTLEPLAYYPDSRPARESAAAWLNPGFEIFFFDPTEQIAYEPYTQSVGYGRVRLPSSEEFAEANESGQLSFQDILVLERAPRDIEGVVGGVITAERQGELSHVAVRTARRGTPNAFVRDAVRELAGFEGRLARLEVKETGYTIEPATLEEAEAFWDSNRPTLTQPPLLDRDFAELSSLEEIARQEAVDGVRVVSRFGGKASGLARLQPILTGPWAKYRLAGFGIPVRYYLEFMASNSLPSALDRGRDVTYEKYLEELFENEEFRTSSALRFSALAALREHMIDESQVEPELVAKLAARIGEIYSDLSESDRVRFRSSSNVEDSLEFNGAGLYDSLSVCAADDLDDNGAGPSLCDPSRQNERGIARGLRRVWASLWNFRAYEERAFFGIDQTEVAMGLLSNKAFVGELANGVAFTGNPTNPLDRSYVITAQPGEESVVSPEPGVVAEKDLLEVVDGKVVNIVRATPSSLVPSGTFVLSDAQLEELGALMAHIDRNYPLELGDYQREDVLLDLEFKIEAAGDLSVKQVRPFLLSATRRPTPTFALEVPEGTEVCAVFTGLDGNGIGLGPEDWYELKSTLRLVPGRIELPTRADTFSADLVDELRIGPRREIAVPTGSGRFRVRRAPGGNVTTYTFDYEQAFDLAGGETLELRLFGLKFDARGEEPVEAVRTVDERFVTDLFRTEPTLEGLLGKAYGYASCDYELLPLFEIVVEADDGSTVRLFERYAMPPNPEIDTGPASLVRAELATGGSERNVADYWSLIYSATRHNQFAVYWVILDPPLEVEGLDRAIRVVEVAAPEPAFQVEASLRYLDESFEVVAAPGVSAYRREASSETPRSRFVRGDVQADERVDVTDVLALLDYLFGPAEALPCAKAADADDDGTLSLADPISILLHLFGGAGALPDPSGECGVDPTEDDLNCVLSAVCD